MTEDQQRKLYGKMRREAERLLVLKRWIDEHETERSAWRAVDAQFAATLRR